MYYLEFFCKQNLSLLPHLLICSLICINMDSCILWVKIKFYFIYCSSCFSLDHLELLCPFNIPPPFFQHFLAFCHYKIYQVILDFPCINPRKTPLFQGSLFPFIQRMMFRNKNLCIVCTCWYWNITVSSGKRQEMHKCVPTQVYTCVYSHFCINSMCVYALS